MKTNFLTLLSYVLFFSLAIFTVSGEESSEDNCECSFEGDRLLISGKGYMDLCGEPGEPVCSSEKDKQKNVKSVSIIENISTISQSAFSSFENLDSVIIEAPVESIESNAFYSCAGLTSMKGSASVLEIASSSFERCEKLKTFDNFKKLESIAQKAFYGCKSLTSINIPESVINIGEDAFKECSNLLSGTLNSISWSIDKNGVMTLEGEGDMRDFMLTYCRYGYSCSRPWDSAILSIKKVDIKDGIKSIGSDAFSGCSNLTEVSIPMSVEKIGSGAFRNCSSLKAVDIRGNVKEIAGSAFEGCKDLSSVNLPSSLERISNYAFSSCSKLKTIDIPEGVSYVGTGAFQSCSSLESIQLPKNLQGISDSVFASCTDLKSVKIQDGVGNIGQSAFEGCAALEKIEIPDTVTEISGNAFRSCTTLTSVSLPCSLVPKTEQIFSGGTIETLVITGSGKLKFKPCGLGAVFNSIVVQASIDSLEEYAFADCKDLSRVELSSSITKIGRSAFEGCSKLESVTLPAETLELGENSFLGCTELKAVELNAKLRTIGSLAFAGCSQLSSMEIPKSVTYIGDLAFRNCPALAKFIVEEENVNYASLDGVLFEKRSAEKLDLFRYPAGSKNESYRVPSSVSVVKRSAFSGSKNLKMVVLTNQEALEDSAFEFCSNLSYIDIPASVELTGRLLFEGCSNLRAGKLDGVTWELDPKTSEMVFGGNGTMRNFRSCTEYIRPWESVKNSVLRVTIQEGITSIGSNAFCSLVNVEKVDIPAGLSDIGTDAFAYDSSLTSGKIGSAEWTVDIESKKMKVTGTGAIISFSDVLYSVQPWDFHRDSVKELIISDGITDIGNFAFSLFHELESVQIPASVTAIRKGAFDGCETLSKVIFDGLVEPKFCDASAFSETNISSVIVAKQYSSEMFCGIRTVHKVTVKSSGLRAVWIAAIVVFSCIFVAAIIVFVVFIVRKKGSPGKVELTDMTTSGSNSTDGSNVGSNE